MSSNKRYNKKKKKLKIYICENKTLIAPLEIVNKLIQIILSNR